MKEEFRGIFHWDWLFLIFPPEAQVLFAWSLLGWKSHSFSAKMKQPFSVRTIAVWRKYSHATGIIQYLLCVVLMHCRRSFAPNLRTQRLHMEQGHYAHVSFSASVFLSKSASIHCVHMHPYLSLYQDISLWQQPIFLNSNARLMPVTVMLHVGVVAFKPAVYDDD